MSKTFANMKSTSTSGEYVANIKYNNQCRLKCVANKKSKNISTQENYILIQKNTKMCNNNYNREPLYYGLNSKMDLSVDFPIIANFVDGDYPISLKKNVISFVEYEIDPYGKLFGSNNECTNNVNNYEKYVIPNFQMI